MREGKSQDNPHWPCHEAEKIKSLLNKPEGLNREKDIPKIKIQPYLIMTVKNSGAHRNIVIRV